MSIYQNEPWNASFPKRPPHLTGNALNKREKEIKEYYNSKDYKKINNKATKKRWSAEAKYYLLSKIRDNNYKYFNEMKLYDELFDEFRKSINYEILTNTKKIFNYQIPNRDKEDLEKHYGKRFRNFLRNSGYYQEANNNFRNNSNFNNTINNSNNATQPMAATQPTKKRRRLSGGSKKKKKSKRKIHKGPRGGKYYIKKGKKVYLRK
tara:strand:+ start:103 stop:723 length:621 start_codon:yes stop_codon:yes gene_type:complete